MASISLPIRYSSSGIRWGDNHRYPHTPQCYGLEPGSHSSLIISVLFALQVSERAKRPRVPTICTKLVQSAPSFLLPRTLDRRHSLDCRVHTFKISPKAKRQYTDGDCMIWIY